MPATEPLKIGVVGAGPGGISAATTASRRGHRVTLCEAHERLGGWLVPGSVPKTKYEIGNYLSYLEGQLERCAKEHDLTLKLNTTVTPESLKKENFDVLVVCSGAKPVKLEVEGAELPHVVHATDLFLHPEWAKDARDVVIVGGGAVGCEAAHWLAVEHGKQVALIEILPYFMKDIGTANRGHLIHELERHGAKLFNCSHVKHIRTGEVIMARNISPTVPDPYVTWTPVLPENIPNPLAKPIREEMVEERIKADLVVIAVGLQADHSLFEACQAQNVSKDIFAIGDNFRIGHVFEAVEAGFNIGRSL